MALLRARTLDVKQTREFTSARIKNIELNEQEALSGQTILKSVPQRLVLEMTSACNINCKMCGRNAADFKPTVSDPKWLELFEPITNRLSEITLLGWGEPTLHPQFEHYLKWGHDHDLQIFFCTNGTRLDILRNAIFDNHVDLLTVSLDGADAQTNDSIRRGSSFGKITANIRAIVKERERRGITYPYISIVMTMMQSNFRQFPDYVRLAHNLGIEEVKGVYLTVFENRLLDELMYGKSVELKKIFDESRDIAERYGINIKLPYLQGSDIAADKLHKDCYAGWRDFFLGSDGYVRSCMSTSRKLFRIDKYHTFEEMWNSPEYMDFRSRVNTENMELPCQHCYQASTANWNRKNSFVQIGNEFSPSWE